MLSDLKNMLIELWLSRDLVGQLIYRDFIVNYRQSYLGFLWAIFPQLVTVVIFTFLANKRVFDMGQTDLPYVIHALWSVSVWQLFASSIVKCTDSLVKAGSLVTKINFNKEALVFASLGQPILDFVVRLVPIAIVFVWFGFIPSVSALWLPAILFFMLLLALGIGFFLALINLVLRDIGNIVSMIVTFGMFFAPILYPPPVKEPFYLVNVLNPFSPFLISTQELLSGSSLSHFNLLCVMGLLSIGVFFTGWRVFRVTMPRIAERA